MERNTSMLQVQQSVWKGIFRGEGKEKELMDVESLSWSLLGEKGTDATGFTRKNP